METTRTKLARAGNSGVFILIVPTVLLGLGVPRRASGPADARRTADGTSSAPAGHKTSASSPVPLVNSPVVPNALAPGSPGFSLTVNGTGFVSGATVEWNGSPRATTFVSSSQLTAFILAADVASLGTATVTVRNTSSGTVSNPAFFSITNTTPSVFMSPGGSTPNEGYQAAAIATADFNNDGILDFAVASCGTDDTCDSPGTLAIQLGDGKGNFTQVASLSVGEDPTAIAVGDFNNDGNLDIAVAGNGYAGTISILLGDGTGQFTAAAPVSVGAGPDAIGMGDFNGDGNLDLAVANFGSSTVTILGGDGNGDFSTLSNTATGAGPHTLVVSDFNRDGNLDVAVLYDYTSTGIDLLEGDGAGNLSLTSSVALTDGAGLAVADFNGDGIPDLATTGTANGAGSVLIYLGNGIGGFSLASTTIISSYYHSPGMSVAAADFNGDNKMDVAVTIATYGDQYVMIGNGSGGFTQTIRAGGVEDSSPLIVGDFNGDGRFDLVATSDEYESVPVAITLQTLVTVMPTGLTFNTQPLHTSSPLQTATVTNTSGAPVTISAVSTSGDFHEKDDCVGVTLPSGSSCVVGVRFRPGAKGYLTGSVTIAYDLPGSPQVMLLSGMGTEIKFTPPFLNFGDQEVGTKSPPMMVTVTNVGSTPVNVYTWGFLLKDGRGIFAFAPGNTCGTKLFAHNSCELYATFTPSGATTYSAEFTVSDDSGGANYVNLYGAGVDSPHHISAVENKPEK